MKSLPTSWFSDHKFPILILSAVLFAALVVGCGSTSAAAVSVAEAPTPTPLPLPTVAASPTTAPTEVPTVVPTTAPTIVPTSMPMTMPTTSSTMMGGGEMTVNVVAKETDAGIVYMVDKSAVPAGKVKFVFKNDGKLTHELMVYPLQDLSAMLNAKRQGQDVDEMDYIKNMAGQVEEVDPGKSDSLEVTLSPGFYELACHVLGKNKDGTSFTHFEKGQFFTLAVTGSGGPSDNVATPSNTMNVKMSQGTSDLASSWLFMPDRLDVKAGTVTFKVTNNMKEEHDFAVYPIGDTTSFIAMQLKGGMDPDYDTIHAQVVQANLEAGQSVTKALRLTPGVYVAACYMVSKGADGVSFVHMEHGQRFTFTVN